MSSMVQDAYDMGITSELGGMPSNSFYNDDYEDNYIEKEPDWFATSQEAQDYAKKNIGKIITRSPDGNGYIIKK